MKRLFFMLLVILMVAGCSKSPQEKMVGVWQEVDGSQETIEFFEDGTFSAKLQEGSIKNVNGTWTILKDGRLKIDVSMLGMTNSNVYKLAFDGIEMIMTDDDGDATRHKRLK